MSGLEISTQAQWGTLDGQAYLARGVDAKQVALMVSHIYTLLPKSTAAEQVYWQSFLEVITK